jgi:3-oxoacyl-[acyl-carrier protein] reductase
MDIRLDGRVALVTGGAGGFGRAFSRALAESGAAVAVVDIDGGAAEAHTAALNAAGMVAAGFQADVTQAAEVERLMGAVADRFGGLDILVNLAGDNTHHTVQEMPEAEWDRLLDLNLKSMFLCCRAALPLLIARGGGRIINMASHIATSGRPGQAHYAATKAGVIALTTSLAQEVMQHRITVNGFAPGGTESGMWHRSMDEAGKAERRRVNRVGQPEDLAPFVVFLCSDQAYHLTGHIIARDHFMPRG